MTQTRQDSINEINRVDSRVNDLHTDIKNITQKILRQKQSFNAAIDEVLVQYQTVEPEIKGLDQRIEDVQNDMVE